MISPTTTQQEPEPALAAAENEARQYLSADDPHGRLMLAMAASIQEKGFSETVVADVVRIARVSRRTFYEHFEDREDCFLALCDTTTAWIRDVVAQSMEPGLPWREQIERSIDTYIELLTLQPRLTRSFMFEVYSLGERGVAQHRAVLKSFAEQLCDTADQMRAEHPQLNPVSLPLASAIIAGIGELAMLVVDEQTDEAVAQLRSVAIELMSDVLTAPRA